MKTILKKIYFFMIFSPARRTKFIRKHKEFKSVGKNFFFQPRKYPNNPSLISFGDNVSVASNVTFVNHDVMHRVFNNIEINSTREHMGTIEVGNNVFIGANVTILPNAKIGNNCIIASGAVVSGKLKDGGIYGGVPAKKIGDFQTLFEQRKLEKERDKNKTKKQIIEEL